MYSVGQATCVTLVAPGSRCCAEVRNAIGLLGVRPVNEKGGLGGRAWDCDAALTGLSHARTWEFMLPIKRAPCWVDMARPSHLPPPSAQSLLRIIQEEHGFSRMLECPGGCWRGSHSQPLPSLQPNSRFSLEGERVVHLQGAAALNFSEN